MNMNLVQGKVQHQKLILTSEMRQSLRILQMPLFELQQDIDRELAENPLLEVVPEENTPDEPAVSGTNAELNYQELIQNLEMADYDRPSVDNDFTDRNDPLNLVTAKNTLKDYLMAQLFDLKEEGPVIAICKYIIENIDERGYLNGTVEEIAVELKIEVDRVSYALELVQDFQPWGIAARDLKECLKIQLRKKQVREEYICRLVEECLELLADNKMKEIAKKLQISVAEVQQACQIIRTLEPKPARGFDTGNPEHYIIPEAYIRKIGDEFYILMNESFLPKLTINQLYKSIIKKPEDAQTVNFVKDKLNSAVLLIKNIEHRNRTLYRILQKIVELQKEYFNMGEHFLKPMSFGDIAVALNLHESTVSRAVRDKYIGTPFHTVKLKDLLPSGSALMERRSVFPPNSLRQRSVV